MLRWLSNPLVHHLAIGGYQESEVLRCLSNPLIHHLAIGGYEEFWI